MDCDVSSSKGPPQSQSSIENDSQHLRDGGLHNPTSLQVIAQVLHSLSVTISLVCFILLLCFPISFALMVLYILGIVLSAAGSSGNLSRRNDSFRRSTLMKAYASYFPCKLHRTMELDSNKKYIFAYHPHGIICHGAFAAFATEALGFSRLFPNIINSLLTLDTNFKTPFYREYLLSCGLGGVSRSSCKKILSQGGTDAHGSGRAITIAVGGARESLLAKPRTMRLVLKDRKGFVKIAVEQGADLVPVLGFGENDLYDQVDVHQHPRIRKMQNVMKKYIGWTIPLFYGQGIFNGAGLLPYPRPVNVVVGRPISVSQQQKPDPEYIDELHQTYRNEIRRIWDEWKDVYAKDREEELEIL